MRSTLAVLLACACLVATAPASANQCLEDSQARAFKSASVVVIATATRAPASDATGVRRVTLHVERLLKGAADENVEVLVAGFKGGFPFAVGGRYLVFADRNDAGELWVYDCSGTVAMEHSTQAMALVEAELAKGPKPPPSSASSSPAAMPSASPSASAPVVASASPVSAPPAPTDAPESWQHGPPPRPPEAVAPGGCASCALVASGDGGGAGLAGAILAVVVLGARRRRRTAHRCGASTRDSSRMNGSGCSRCMKWPPGTGTTS